MCSTCFVHWFVVGFTLSMCETWILAKNWISYKCKDKSKILMFNYLYHTYLYEVKLQVKLHAKLVWKKIKIWNSTSGHQLCALIAKLQTPTKWSYQLFVTFPTGFCPCFSLPNICPMRKRSHRTVSWQLHENMISCHEQ